MGEVSGKEPPPPKEFSESRPHPHGISSYMCGVVRSPGVSRADERRLFDSLATGKCGCKREKQFRNDVNELN